MGAWHAFHSERCGKGQRALIGAGMMVPEVCGEALAEVGAGKHGQRLREAAEGEPFAGARSFELGST